MTDHLERTSIAEATALLEAASREIDRLAADVKAERTLRVRLEGQVLTLEREKRALQEQLNRVRAAATETNDEQET